jgi:hypothetical protein
MAPFYSGTLAPNLMPTLRAPYEQRSNHDFRNSACICPA